MAAVDGRILTRGCNLLLESLAIQGQLSINQFFSDDEKLESLRKQLRIPKSHVAIGYMPEIILDFCAGVMEEFGFLEREEMEPCERDETDTYELVATPMGMAFARRGHRLKLNCIHFW